MGTKHCKYLPVLVLGGLSVVAPLAAQTSAPTQADSASQKMMKSADTAFAMKAAEGGLTEVKLGQLAAEKATNLDVKAFGQQMVDDHTKANTELKSVAGAQGMTLPTELNAKHQAMYTKLQNTSGAEFDHMYVRSMVKDHEEDVKDFQKEANSGKDPQIKDFASKTLPVLQGHLEKVKALQSSVGK
jgi:putative membrane protein